VTPDEATVDGRLAVGGGNDWLEIWLVGAGCTEPVYSAEGAELRDANGLALGLLKREVSELQPVNAAVSTPTTAIRDKRRRLADITTERMAYSLLRNMNVRSEQALSKDWFKQETTA
jgi:hypothetical protein